jgi:Chaperone of endosialidase
MSFQENLNVGPEAISPENVPAVQQTCVKTSRDVWGTRTLTGQQTNVQTINGALGIVERLRGVSFDWTPDGKHDIGFIAEEVAEVLPEAVAYDETGKDAKAVDYSRLVAVLIAAVKEQQVQIRNLEHSLKEQKGQVAKLRGEIERLKISIRAATVR